MIKTTYKKLLKQDVFFITGTDEHGQKIERTASNMSIPPQDHCNKIAKEYIYLWKK